MYRLTVKHHFDAAHFLEGYHGKCAQLHGHRWVVEVTVKGEQLDNIGMLVDFSLIKDSLKELLGDFDHHLLNELKQFAGVNPTAENLARFCYYHIKKDLPPKIVIEKIRIYETPDAWAEYWEE